MSALGYRFAAILLLTLIQHLSPLGAQTKYAVSGTDFMFCIPDRRNLHPYTSSEILLIVSSLHATQFTLTCPGIGYNQTFNLAKNSVEEIYLPNIGVPKGVEQPGDTTWSITSGKPVSVMLRKSVFKGSGIMNVFPIQACGSRYRVCGYRNESPDYPQGDPSNMIAITALCDNTDIRVHPTDTSTTGRILPNQPFVIQLDKGESYLFRTPDILDFVPFPARIGDFTGTVIESLNPRKKIAVTVHDFDQVGPESAFDYMYEMLAPDKMADTLFYDFTSQFNKASRYRVIPTQDSTRIWINNQYVKTLNVDTFYQFDDSTQLKLHSDKPVLLYRFIFSTTFATDKWGDPELLRIEPARTGITKSIVLPRERGNIRYAPNTTKHYLQIICRSGHQKSFRLNGSSQAQAFQPFSIDNDWVYADLEVDTNLQYLQSDEPFIGFYGISAPHGSLAHNLTGETPFDRFNDPPQRIVEKRCRFPFTLEAPILADSLQWWNGQTTPGQTITDTGKYWVRQILYAECGTPQYRTDTLHVVLGEIDYQQKNGDPVCLDDLTTTEIDGVFDQIAWEDGTTTPTRSLSPNRAYPFQLTYGKCTTSDRVWIPALPEPKVGLESTFYSCGPLDIPLDLTQKGAKSSDSTQFLPAEYFTYLDKNQYRAQSERSFTGYLKTINYHGCSATDTLEFTVEGEPDSLIIDPLYDCHTQSLTLEVANYTDDRAIRWQLNGTEYDGTRVELTSVERLKGTLYFTYGVQCSAEQDFDLGDHPFLGEDQISNVFTPNGDGVNDKYHPIVQEENRPCTALQVFNRWGQLLFSSDDGSCWNGTINNKDAAAGVYFYTLSAFGDELKGHVTLIR